eukprot:9483195-Pyramimonas_sp.AAC.1
MQSNVVDDIPQIRRRRGPCAASDDGSVCLGDLRRRPSMEQRAKASVDGAAPPLHGPNWEPEPSSSLSQVTVGDILMELGQVQKRGR